MESKIISVYDYHNIDLSEYQKQFIPDEAAVQKEISSLQNKYCRWEEGEEICKGDIVSCRLQSELPRFQKENAQIAVGSGLLNRELEDSLVGKRKGEPVCVRAEGADVTVSVEEIRHRIVSDLTDSQIKDLGIDGVQNLEGFKTYLARQQREKFLDEIEYPAIQYVTSEVLRESVCGGFRCTDEWLRTASLHYFRQWESGNYRFRSSCGLCPGTEHRQRKNAPCPAGFYRCYQSFLVNLSKVSFIRVDNESKNYALLLEGYAGEILLSRNKYQEVLKLLKNKFAGISL